METPMQYKTISLELLKGKAELYRQLRRKRLALATVETCAAELKASHERWKQAIAKVNPGSHPTQIASEALELAIEELRERLSITVIPKDLAPLPTDRTDPQSSNGQRPHSAS
jgi:hypothetical protein